MDRQQNLSYAQVVRAANEEIEAFNANVIINVQQLTKIITAVLWKINREKFNFINQLANRVAQVVRQSVSNSTV